MFLIGGALLLANWPWTIFAIMPTNRVLMATGLEAASSQSRALIVKWNRLHSVRTVLRCLAILAFLIGLRMTGEHATDVADASGTLMLDVARRRWSSELMAAVGLPEACLPRLFESEEICARVCDEGARATGLRAGTPVVAGAGDQAGGAVGLGIVRPGDVSATIGTSGVVFAATDRPAMDLQGSVHTFCHATPERWHVMGVTQAAGLSLRWFRDLLLGLPTYHKGYQELINEAAATPAGADGLLWAPYLMSERTPHLDPRARGALVGLSASHTRGHVVRAILEGIAFSLKDTLTLFDQMKVPIRTVRLGGGGARSPLWCQIQADIYGHEETPDSIGHTGQQRRTISCAFFGIDDFRTFGATCTCFIFKRFTQRMML